MKLEIGVWQFVRIMVELEAEAGRAKAGRRPNAYDDWREPWDELDGRLTELAARDHAAYADLMMNQNVVVQYRGDKHGREVVHALDRVINDMKGEIRRGGKGQRLKDLRFESRELQSLRGDLAAQALEKGARKGKRARAPRQL